MESVESLLEEVGNLHRRSRAYTQRERFPEAARYLEEAIALLEPELSAARERETESGVAPRLALSLADTYGRLGGVLRRMGDLGQARAAYRKGAELEGDPALQLVNSYCSTNALVLEFLLSGEGPEYADRVRAARQTTLAQAEGPRREDWWAWAEVAILAVLLGDAEAATGAFERFSRAGARPADIDSVTPVLAEIAARAEKSPDVASSSRRMIDVLAGLRVGD